jgi:cytochrome bd-type quinol oxidase subunit 2
VENNLLVHRLGGWGFGMVLAIGYIVFVYAKFRGKVDLRAGGH